MCVFKHPESFRNFYSNDIQKLMLDVRGSWERPHCLCSWVALARKAICHPDHGMLERERCQCASGSMPSF